MLTGFCNLLRDFGIPISLHEVMDFHRGLEKGLVNDLDELFLYARLSMVKRVEHMDLFQRAFAYYFYGVDLPAVAEGDPEIFKTSQFQEWLRNAVQKGEIPRNAYWNMPAEELMKKFWDTVKEQMKAHHGGNKWVGTGGTSPFGHSGFAERGIRVYGSSGARSAIKVIGDRNYINYSADQTLSGDNIRQALESLKHLKKTGPEDELNLDETIHHTARNGGEIDLIFHRELKDKIRVVLLIDNGGYSMTPYVDLTRLLFSKMHARFREFSTYYFHNTIYNRVYQDPRRTKPFLTKDLLKKSTNTRIIILGDASMAPEELAHPHGSIYIDDLQPISSLDWLKKLKKRFPYIVWLNPIPRHEWNYGVWTLDKIRELFHMEELTLRGIKQMVDYLNRHSAAH